jgi:hypothetical protein
MYFNKYPKMSSSDKMSLTYIENVYKCQKYLQMSKLFTDVGNVYKGRKCLQRSKIFTKVGNVYKGRKCLQRSKMFTTVKNVYKGRKCLQRSKLSYLRTFLEKSLDHPLLLQNNLEIFSGSTFM